ncbi:hypothetical protein BS47DRAFT_1399041 [Hydnum rufescens UP504]|uniref:Uncharacterized protein n=1 Tax=Hydnum rufescens UP504 TaxID=1448309 RepID=A0A9P6AKB9_9AGAM|nr:hypothetical protein BS47DRAFT_1399041 [Hydnum rufescens UP504]
MAVSSTVGLRARFDEKHRFFEYLCRLDIPYPNSYGSYNRSVSNHGVNLHSTNPDLWRAHYQIPRFGQGSFRQAFQAVFGATTGAEHPYIQYGEPSRLTCDYGTSMLKAEYLSQTSHPSKIVKEAFAKASTVYGFGNPECTNDALDHDIPSRLISKYSWPF